MNIALLKEKANDFKKLTENGGFRPSLLGKVFTAYYTSILGVLPIIDAAIPNENDTEISKNDKINKLSKRLREFLKDNWKLVRSTHLSYMSFFRDDAATDLATIKFTH